MAAFAGYFALARSDSGFEDKLEYAEPFIISLGIIFSIAWYFVNKGSKKWQENWEKHIDMLEEDVTGNIYKSVLNKDGYSVSGINLVVSQFVFTVWVVLLFRYVALKFDTHGFVSDYYLWPISIGIILFIFIWKLRKKYRPAPRRHVHGDGLARISFDLRDFEYVNPQESKVIDDDFDPDCEVICVKPGRSHIWKFVHHDNYQYKSTRLKGRSCNYKWLKIEKDGTITVKGARDNKRGYAWDGCTPKWNAIHITWGNFDGQLKKFDKGDYKPYTYYASMIHDVLYQYKRCVPITRKEADLIFLDMLKESGYKWAKVYYRGVRALGWIYKGWKNK